jgi:hypothetical protein
MSSETMPTTATAMKMITKISSDPAATEAPTSVSSGGPDSAVGGGASSSPAGRSW